MNTDSGKLDFEIRLLLDNMQRDAKRAQDIISGIGTSAEKEGSRIDDAFKKAGVAIAGFFTLQQATNFVKQVANIRGEMQNLETAFKTMLGSKKEADALMSQLIQTAATTPFGMSEVANGAKQLLAYGLEADKVNDTLIRLGDIAAGLSIPLGDLSYLYGTTMVQGRLYTQDLNQFLGRGIPLTKELAAQFGVAESEVKKLVEEGKVGFPQVKKAIENLTNEGSKFGGLMQEQSKNINGQISNIEDSIDQMLNNIGKKNEGVIYTALGAVSSLVENYEEIGGVIAKLIGMYGSYKAAIIVLNAAKAVSAQLTAGWTLKELAHYKALVLVEKGQKLLNATILKNPYVLVGAAVAGLTAFLWNFFEVEDQTKKATEDHAKALEELNSKYDNEKQNISNLLGLLESETASRQNQIEALEELKKLYPDIIGKYIDENDKITDRVALEKEINTELSKRKELELGEKSANASIMLNRYKEMLKAQESGKGARNADWAKELLADKPLIKSTTAYIKEQIQYWEVEAKKSADEFNKVYISGFKADLESKTDADLEALKKYYEERNKKFAFLNKGELDAINEEIAKRYAPQTAETQNKAFWEKEKQKAVDELNALADIEENKKQRDELLKLIEDYDKHLAFYSADNKGGGNDNKKAYDDAVASVQDETTKLTRDTASEQETDEVKKLQQEKANALADHDKEAAAEIAKFKELKLDTAELTEEYRKLREAKVAAYDMQIAAATDKQVAEEKAKLDEILNDYATYEQQLEAIKNKYNDKRAQMYTTDESGNQILNTDAGVTQGNVDEINSAEQLEQQALDEQFAMREAEYLAYCEQIADATLNQLQNDLLPRAQQMLASLEKSGASGQKVAAAKMAVKKTQEQIDDRKKNGDVPDKQAIKQWQALGDCIGETGDILSELGDEVGGVSGEFLAAAGNILSSTSAMVNTIATLASSAGQGMSLTAMMASESISTVEKASVILAIISAAIQIVMAIVNAVRKALDKQHAEKMEELQKRVDALKDSYEELEEVLDEQFGQSANATLEEMNKNLEEQNRQLQEMIAAEESSKMGDEDAAQEYRDQIEENKKLIEENKKAAEEAIFGESVKSAIENFAEAYADAWASNEHSATSMRDTVRDMMQKMVTESIKDAIQCSGAINKIHEAMQAMWADGVLTEAEVEQLYAMADEAQAELDAKYGETLDNLNDPNREGVKKGIATASQESVDENNARLTTIQGHTYQLNENIAVVRTDIASSRVHLQNLQELASDAIDHLATISEHTAELVTMNVRINKMQAALEDINTRGVKIKN